MIDVHFTGTVYRNPYCATFPLLQVTQGRTHNKCKFCTMYSEKEMLIELKTFVENLTCDRSFITHHTISGKNLTGPDFLKRKDSIIAALDDEINHGNMDMLAAIRRNKRSL